MNEFMIRTKGSDSSSREISILETARQRAVEEARKMTGYQPYIYYHMVDGVAAVLTPEAMQEARLTTPPGWKGPTLYPSRSTITFIAPEEGEATIKARAGTLTFDTKVAGTTDDLQRLVALYGLEVIRTPGVFVPWVDQSRLSFARQHDIIADCVGADLYRELVARQFPNSMLSLLLGL